MSTYVISDEDPSIPVASGIGFPRGNPLSDGMLSVFDECVELALKKNHDYSGGKHIDNIPLTGTHGLAVRLLDKVCRLLSLHEVSAEVQDEKLRDTFMDIVNYGTFGVMLLDDTWGKSNLAEKEVNTNGTHEGC
jgi:hypothetical protein